MHTSIKVGDRVRFILRDGSLSKESVEVREMFGGKDTAANFSYFTGSQEQLGHSDLVHRDGDDSPITVPPVEEWFIAIGNRHGWGRARTEAGAIANMRSQGGKPDAYVVHRVNQWTRVNEMGGLTHPIGRGDPVEVKRIEPKAKSTGDAKSAAIKEAAKRVTMKRA